MPRDPLPDIVERFHRRHEELYTYSMRDQETVLVNARVAVSGILSALPQEPLLPEIAPAKPRAERRIWFDEWIAAPVYAFEALAPAQIVIGPAIVESPMTTVLLRPASAPRLPRSAGSISRWNRAPNFFIRANWLMHGYRVVCEERLSGGF